MKNTESTPKQEEAGESAEAASAVTTYGANNAGARASSFELDGLRVLVSHFDDDRNEECFAVARELSRARATIAALTADRDAFRARVVEQKREPARLLGAGYVRFRGDEMWLLGNRERGFGHFGYRFDGWDELFRRYDVRVTGHGEDEHGAWWSVENNRAEGK